MRNEGRRRLLQGAIGGLAIASGADRARRRRHRRGGGADDREGRGPAAAAPAAALSGRVVPLDVAVEPAEAFRAWLFERPARGARVTLTICAIAIEYGLVVDRARGRRACCPAPSRAASARASASRFYAIDRGASPAGGRAAARGVSGADRRRECRAIARATFAHFGRLLVARAAVQHAARPTRFARASSSRARSASARRSRPARAPSSSPATSGSGSCRAWRTRWCCRRCRCWRGRSTIRTCTSCSSACARATGNRVIYRQGAIRRVLRALSANECVAILIDQHIHGADAVKVDFFNRPAATTSALATLALRTGAPLVPAFALPLAGGRYRLIYEHPVELPPAESPDPVRELTQRCTRRARDVRAPASAPLAVDAPALARCDVRAGRRCPGMFPAAASDESESRRMTVDRLPAVGRVGRAAAELAGRRGPGAAGDGGDSPAFPAAAPDDRRAAGGRGAVPRGHATSHPIA